MGLETVLGYDKLQTKFYAGMTKKEAQEQGLDGGGLNSLKYGEQFTFSKMDLDGDSVLSEQEISIERQFEKEMSIYQKTGVIMGVSALGAGALTVPFAKAVRSGNKKVAIAIGAVSVALTTIASLITRPSRQDIVNNN